MSDDKTAPSRDGSADSWSDGSADPSKDDSATPTGDASAARASDASADDATTAESESERASRDVVVPDHVYRVVTVFSTLFAVLFVVGGMIALDLATDRGAAAAEDVELLRATAGVCSIVLGAAVYAFSSRFRAAGMGNPKDADDEQSDDGRRVR